jgi:hypothetical protein
MTRFSFGAAALALVLMGSLVSGQAPAPGQGRGGGRGGAPQPAPTNLQVLPKDWTRQQVVQVMQQFNQALGVTCAHCHVFIANGDPMNDFAADTKPTKNIARQMVLMVREINPLVQKAVAPKAADQVANVNCAMCHRGSAIPSVPPPTPPGGPGGPGGAPGAPGGRGNQ